MIPIALKFLSQQFIASVEAGNMARCSSKSDKLRNINSIGYMRGFRNFRQGGGVQVNLTKFFCFF